MITQFVEVTDNVAYGKFMVARLDVEDLDARTAMPEAQPPLGSDDWAPRLLSYGGRRRFNDHSTLVIDLQRGTGYAWPLEGGEIGMLHYRNEKLGRIEHLVCPMYMPFVQWLHEKGEWAHGAGDITLIPRYLPLVADLMVDEQICNCSTGECDRLPAVRCRVKRGLPRTEMLVD